MTSLISVIRGLKKKERGISDKEYANRQSKDLCHLADLRDVLTLRLSHPEYIEDDSLSISSFSTNATMDDNLGPGRTIDKHFYQPVGRAIEKVALEIGVRLNVCHPSPAHILRYILGLYPGIELWFGEVRRQSDVIESISTEEPTIVLGLMSLVKQSQSNSVYRSYSALAALIRVSIVDSFELIDFFSSFANEGSLFHLETLANSCPEREYLHSLVDLGRATLIASNKSVEWDTSEQGRLRFAFSLRQDFLGIVNSQQAYHDVSITSVGKAFIVFAKASRFQHNLVVWASSNPSDPAAQSVVETTYFSLIFLIRSVSDLYLRLDDMQSTAFNLHHLFLSTLLDLFNAVANNLIKYYTNNLRSLEWVMCAILLRSPFYAVRETRNGMLFPIANLDSRIIIIDTLPRRARLAIQSDFGSPQMIQSYTKTYVSLSRQFLLSLAELEGEVRHGAPALKLCTPSLKPGLGRTDQQLLYALDTAQRAQVCCNDLTKEFLRARDDRASRQTCPSAFEWRPYKEKRESNRLWGQHMLCSYDWDWDPSACLRQLFTDHLDRSGDRNQPLPVQISGVSNVQSTQWVIESPEGRAPKEIKVAYRTRTGEIKHKIFRVEVSMEDLDAASESNFSDSDGNVLPSTSEDVDVDSSLAEDKIEYERIAEYREINRHARRKIGAWLNSGWSVAWEWNGQYDWEVPAHWMTLTKSKTGLYPHPENRRVKLEFPYTPGDSESESELSWHDEYDPW